MYLLCILNFVPGSDKCLIDCINLCTEKWTPFRQQENIQPSTLHMACLQKQHKYLLQVEHLVLVLLLNSGEGTARLRASAGSSMTKETVALVIGRLERSHLYAVERYSACYGSALLHALLLQCHEVAYYSLACVEARYVCLKTLRYTTSRQASRALTGDTQDTALPAF